MSERPINLLICVASGRDWKSRFGHSLAALAMHLGFNRLDGRLHRVSLRIHHGAYLVQARNAHIIEGLKGGYTHVLSLDDDMMFPANSVDRMIAHDKAVVTVNYRKKLEDRLEFVCTSPGGHMTTSFNKTGIEPVIGMGMGLTLIDMDKIRHVPGPYFAVLWNEATGENVLEDSVFCALLQSYGVEIWCDHSLSQDVKHVGDYEFGIPTPRPLELFPTLEKKHESQKQATG